MEAPLFICTQSFTTMNLKRTHHCEIVAGNRFKKSLSKKKKQGPQAFSASNNKNKQQKVLKKSQAFDEIVLLACCSRDSLKLGKKQLVRTAITTVNLNLHDIVSCCSHTQFQLVDRRAKLFLFIFWIAKATLGINQNINTKAKTTRNINNNGGSFRFRLGSSKGS